MNELAMKIYEKAEEINDLFCDMEDFIDKVQDKIEETKTLEGIALEKYELANNARNNIRGMERMVQQLQEKITEYFTIE